MGERGKKFVGFWTTLPGIISALAVLVGGVTALIKTLDNHAAAGSKTKTCEGQVLNGDEAPPVTAPQPANVLKPGEALPALNVGWVPKGTDYWSADQFSFLAKTGQDGTFTFACSKLSKTSRPSLFAFSSDHWGGCLAFDQ